MRIASLIALLVMGLGAAGAAVAAPAERDCAVRATRAAAALAIPYRRFVLANGLRVIVHTDRTTPVVSVSVRYGVGSKHEAADRAGFAHLFEHLMFAGSDHAPGSFYDRMREIGATGLNGNTDFDSTVFYETVPTGALDRTLFLEADRMGHMEATITPALLDLHRGVVENEKRQNEDAPYGIGAERSVARLFPPGHPYGHLVLGSMQALDAATAEQARAWHRRYYVPANAVLVLSGDIDADTARQKAMRFFGDLAPGSRAYPPAAPLPPAVGGSDTVSDRVPQASVTRHWVTPGLATADGAMLDLAARVLGTLTGSWLDGALVRDARVATSVTVSAGASADIGTFIISAVLAPGVTPAELSRRIDAVLARFAQQGPSRDDLCRVVMRDIGFQTQTQETTAARASALGEGEMLGGDPAFMVRQTTRQAAASPNDVRRVVARWLMRPAYTLTIVPGERARGEQADRAATTPARSPATPASSPLPPVGPAAALRFPAVTRSRLANGMMLVHARRPATPLTRVALTFDGGSAVDAPGEEGAHKLLYAMMAEGAPGRDRVQLAQAYERLGAQSWFAVTPDQGIARLSVPSAAAPAALAQLARTVRRPGFDPAALDRARAAQLAQIAFERTDQQAIARRALATRLYGAHGGYGRSVDSGDERAVAAVSRTRLVALHAAWVRPDKAALIVVSDLPFAVIHRLAQAVFGHWRGVGAAGRRPAAAGKPSAGGTVVIDRPGGTQSLIVAGIPTSIAGRGATDQLFAASVGAEALGNARGRINRDLRENKGWSYGATGGFDVRNDAVSWLVTAPVEIARTCESLQHIDSQLRAFLGDDPLRSDEFDQAIRAGLAALPGRFERGDAVLDSLILDRRLDRAPGFQTSLERRYRTLTQQQATAAVRALLNPSKMVAIVVGDASRIGCDMPMETTAHTGAAAHASR